MYVLHMFSHIRDIQQEGILSYIFEIFDSFVMIGELRSKFITQEIQMVF